MKARSAELNAFLKTLHNAISERAHPDSDAHRVTEIIIRALQVERPSASPKPVWLPVCAVLDDAIQNVATSSAEENLGQPIPINSSLVDHAQALHKLAPQLAWWHRPTVAQQDKIFANGHANATVIGQGGLEERDDVWVGISLMAPGIQYPEHHHPPEEVLSLPNTRY